MFIFHSKLNLVDAKISRHNNSQKFYLGIG